MFTFIPEPNFNVPSGPRQPDTHSSKIEQLRADVERLYFISEALWRILKEKHAMEEIEIIRKIAEIDMEDGKLDGRKEKEAPQPCSKCGRVLARQRAKCMFCGEYTVLNPFDR